MSRMVFLTFAFLGWAWYELSGGSDFVAGDNGVTLLARVETDAPPSAETQPVAVARADTSAARLTAVSAPALDLPVIRPARIEAETEKLATLSDPAVMTDAVEETLVSEASVTAAVSIDYRSVTGNRVNLRQGPGTDFPVVSQLIRGEEVEVLTDAGDGWVKLRALDGNDIGWMSANFLTASN